MITVYIYLDSEENAGKLVKGLIANDLLAHASIDIDNRSFSKIDGELFQQTNVVITGQTKALLFTPILEYISREGYENTKVYSLPITQCNGNFSEIIRQNTQKI
ncbi:MAG: divalent cation tolerance protein CutA [Bacteroidetes bacterium]|nr:divalent cation tolerance protein CutA [Bacteroidota bacterium]